MAQFTYQPYSNPYVSSITQLMERQGEIPAQAALQIGQAQANAAAQQGQIYGGMAQQLGQQLGQIPQEIERQKRQALQDQIIGAQVADLKQRQAGQAAVDTMMRGDQLPQGDAGPRQPSYLDQNGLFDIPKMTVALGQSGLGHMAPELLKGAEAINDSILKHQELQANVAKQNTILTGDIANGALLLMRGGVPIDQAMDMAASPALATQRVAPQDYAKIRAQILSLGPEQQQSALEQFKAQSAKLQPTKTLKEGEIETSIYGDVIGKGGEKKSFEPRPMLLDGQPVEAAFDKETGKYFVNGEDVSGRVQPVKAPKGLQARAVLLDGKPVELAFNPETGGYQDSGGTKIDGSRIKPIPPASVQVTNLTNQGLSNMPTWATDDSRPPKGPEANKVDPVVRMTPNGLYQAAQNYIASGQFPPTGRGSDPTAVAQRAAIVSKVGAIAAAAGVDEPTLRAFYKANAGALSQQQKAYDAASVSIAKADRDVDLLEKVLPKIGDVGSPMFNKPLRSFEQNVAGNPDLAEFATRLRSVQNEYTRILNASLTGSGGGVMSDSARHETDQLLNPNATVEQMIRSIQALKSEGNNRLLSQGEQIQRIMQRMQGGAQPPTQPAGLVPTMRYNPATGKVEPILR